MKPYRFEKLEERRMLTTVAVGDHVLLPDMEDQQIQIFVTPDDPITPEFVQGLNFNIQVADGGPEVGGVVDGPVISDVDIITGTIFEANNLGQVDPEPSGVYETIIHTFAIHNLGQGDLHLTGDPVVDLQGPDADQFYVNAMPETTIAPGDSTTFEIAFAPTTPGLKQATVVVANDDPDENPYTYAIQGTASELDIYPQWEGRFTVAETGSVEADGLLATVTVDTTGFTEGAWDLVMGEDNMNGASDFAGVPINITDGTITLNSAPIGEPDFFEVVEDGSITENVLTNDYDPEGFPIEASKLSDPVNGTLSFGSDGVFTYEPDADFNGQDVFTYQVWDGSFYSDSVLVTITVTPTMDVLDERIVYNNSFWDGDNPGIDPADLMAIAMDKVSLKEGETATYANVSNYEKGLNEILIVVDDLPSTITVNDMTFYTGNEDSLMLWTEAPIPTMFVQENFGDNGEDLLHLVWAEGEAVRGAWLEVAILANDNTELAEDYAFIFGSAPGDIGNSLEDCLVNATDVVGIRNNPHIFVNPATVTDVWDVNRDSLVNATDMSIAMSSGTTFLNDLTLITPTYEYRPTYGGGYATSYLEYLYYTTQQNRNEGRDEILANEEQWNPLLLL